MLSFRWALNIYITFLTIHIHCDFANPGIFVSGRIVNRNADDNAGTVKDVQSSQSENSHDFHQEFHNQFEKISTTEVYKDLSRGYFTTDKTSTYSEYLSEDSENITVSCQEPCGEYSEAEDTEVLVLEVPSWVDFLNHSHRALTKTIVHGWVLPIKELYSELQKQDSIFGESTIKLEETASYTIDMGNSLKHMPSIDPTGASNSGHNSTLSLMKLERSIFIQVSSDSLLLIVLCVVALATLSVTAICVYHKKFKNLHEHVMGQMQRFDTVDDHVCHRA
jgi:hypothetical protein